MNRNDPADGQDQQSHSRVEDGLSLTVEEVTQQILACHKCELSGRAHNSPVPFSVPNPFASGIIVMGEAPGAHENAKGLPFVGPSGRLLRSWLKDVGIDPLSVAYLNRVSCYPARTPTPEHIEACHGNFVSQLEALRPRFVLVAGRVAFDQFWALPLTTARGHWWRECVGDAEFWALATWHPSYALREEGIDKEARRDVALFAFGTRHTQVRPVGLTTCALCDKPAINWYREMGFCDSCRSPEQILETHFPGATWALDSPVG